MAFGNMTATNALRTFEQAGRAVTAATAAVVREQAAGYPNAQVAINAVKSAKQALAVMEAAAQVLKIQGAWFRPEHGPKLSAAQQAVVSINDAAEGASDEYARQMDAERPERDFVFTEGGGGPPGARSYVDDDEYPGYNNRVDGLAGVRSRRKRRRSRRRR